jgi:hypothetical protein
LRHLLASHCRSPSAYCELVTSEAQRDHSFGSGEPFSLGVEEELFLVDPSLEPRGHTSGLATFGRAQGDARFRRFPGDEPHAGASGRRS